MVRHEDYPQQNQNKVPELGEDVIICILSTYGFTYNSVWCQGKLILQRKRQSKTCSTVVLGRGSGCHQW